jgi:DNA-binding transcriptional ArsR family regulator
MDIEQVTEKCPISAVDTASDEALPHPPVEAIELFAVLHALCDPMRLRMVAELAECGGERTCSSFDLPIAKSTCTHHFKVLREAGVIRQKVCGTKRISTLRADDLDARFPGLLEAVLTGAVSAQVVQR